MGTQVKFRDKLNDLLTSDDPKKRVKKYLLITGFMIAVMIVIAVSAKRSDSDGTDLIYTDDGEAIITLTGPENMRIEIPADAVIVLDYISKIEFGTQLSGVETDLCCCGTFQNSAWGEYTLFAEKKITDYILFKTDKDTILFNCNSVRETEALYHALLELGLGSHTDIR